MKFCNISLLFVIFALICSITYTFAEDEAAPAPAPAPTPKRPLRRPIGKAAKVTTTTTAAPPAYDDEGDYQEENQEGGEPAEESDESAVSSTSTTTTEPPKKVGPVIRPFRSNDDFLNSLKRRQMNAKKHLSEKPTPKSRPAPAAEHSDEDAGESAPHAAAAPATPAKGYKSGSSIANRRKLLKPSKPEPVDDAAAAESEPEQEESKLKRPHNARLSLRKRV